MDIAQMTESWRLSWNDHDFDKLWGILDHEGFHYEDIPHDLHMTTEEALRDFHAGFTTCENTLKTEEFVAATPEHGIIRWVWEGKHTAELSPLKLQPTGASFVLRGCTHLRSQSGKVVKIEGYYDVAGVLLQLQVPEDELRRLGFL